MCDESEIIIPGKIRPYLNEIAERLWNGRAAVMVGAGFSKNADTSFPDWNQLGDEFYQKAYGDKQDSAKQKYLNVLRLADEVNATIGRPALDNLIRTNIPDMSNEPSSLHVDLLELPWVDVFTTNYDTLLERACHKVITRRYEPVINKEDIPYAIKPRIVKLHGSFPSQRPFIITEEDYRRYPRDNAPFVNTVQQSLLENTFCLIGFSGDDPNFLQWIGWIRDNLGKDKTQKIYLVGVFDFSSARQQLLEQRGIIVVDFLCCHGIGIHDHKKALRLFFEYLKSKKPDALDWPYISKAIHPSQDTDINETILIITEEWQGERLTYPGWLILPYDNRKKLWAYTQSWINILPNTEDAPVGFDILYNYELIWRLERCLLPIFDNIAESCEKLLNKYWPFISESPPENYLILAGDERFIDLSWNDIRQAWMAIALSMMRFYREEGNLEKWKEAEKRLKTLSEQLSAEQKEFLNYEGFLFSLFNMDITKAKQRLENWQCNETQPYWIAKRAVGLAEMGLLNDVYDQILESLIKTRKKHKNNTSSPNFLTVSNEAFQMLLLRYVSYASGWIEDKIATQDEELQIKDDLENDWKQGRQSQEPERQLNITIIPQEKFSSFDEDWADLYNNRLESRSEDWLQRLSNVRHKELQIMQQQQNARWDELKAFRCDPLNELELFKHMLSEPPANQRTVSEKHTFDIGMISHSLNIFRADEEKMNAYSFLRFCEEVGLPYRIGNYKIVTNTALASLQRITKHSFFWATVTLVRLGDPKSVDNLYNRESIYKIKEFDIDDMIQSFLDAHHQCRGDINDGDASENKNYGMRLAQLLPEVLSRLYCKCSIEKKYQILEFLNEIYGSPSKSNYRNVKNLTKRLISSMSEVEQYHLVPDLLKIPFPEDLNPRIKNEFLNPFLLLELNQKPEGIADLVIQQELIDHLLEQAVIDDPDRRRWALISLIKLYKLKLLDDDQNCKFTEAIWCVKDQYGLPIVADFYKFTFLELPHPEGVDSSTNFKAYVKDIFFPVDKKISGKGIRMIKGNLLIVNEIIGANSNGVSIWTTDDAIDFLVRILKQWDVDKSILSKKNNDDMRIFSQTQDIWTRYTRIIDLITEVVAPKLSVDTSDEIKASLDRLLTVMKEFNLPVLTAEAACLHIYPEKESDLFERINDALSSNQVNRVREGLKTIYKIVIEGERLASTITSKSNDLIFSLSQYIVYSQTKSISQAIHIVTHILLEAPNFFSEILENSCLKRLSYLLDETAYDNNESDLLFEEKLEIRKYAVTLSGKLHTHFINNNRPVPEVLKEWKEASQSPDEFAEIRNAWNKLI